MVWEWIVVSLGPLGLLAFWLDRRQKAGRRLDGGATPEGSLGQSLPSLQNTWAALLVSLALLITSLGLTMSLTS